MSDQTLPLLGAVAFGWWLRSRRSRAPAAAPGGQVRVPFWVKALAVGFALFLFAPMVAGYAGTTTKGKSPGALFAGLIPNLPKMPTILPTPAPSKKAAKAVAYARRQVGKPYRWAAAGPGAFDCSGLTSAAWRAAGVAIPRTAAGQLKGLRRVAKPKPGDLIVYSSSGPSKRHVVMYVGGNRVVEARSRRTGVTGAALRGGWLGVVRPGVR